LFNLAEHLFNTGGGKGVRYGAPDGFQFYFGRGRGADRTRFAECAPDPFPYGQTFTFGKALDVRHFLVGEQDLETLAHSGSMAYSLDGRNRQIALVAHFGVFLEPGAAENRRHDSCSYWPNPLKDSGARKRLHGK